MGLMQAIFGGRQSAPRERIEPILNAAHLPESTLADPEPWLVDWLAGGPSTFGPPVNEVTAMTCSAVFRSVAIIAGAIAELPLKIYRRTPKGREEVPDHRLAPLLTVAPYPGRTLTAYIWRELWMINVLLWGNHYSIIEYDGAARIVGFTPVMPWNTEVYPQTDGTNRYRCVMRDGSIRWVAQDDMIHIPGPGFDGIRGLSRIQAFARDAVKLAKGLEEQTGIIHENSAKPSGGVAVPAGISPEGFKRMRKQFEERNAGRHNAGRVIFMEAGSEFKPFQMTPEDLNTIQFRGFQVTDIARFFGVPPHLLMETDKTTSWGSGLAEQTLAFLIYTLAPDLGRIEAELNYKLFYGTPYYAEFKREAMLAMDPVKAAQVAQTEIASGTLLINERRTHLNRPPVDGGGQPLINAANVPLAKVLSPATDPRADPPATTGAPAPEPPAAGG